MKLNVSLLAMIAAGLTGSALEAAEPATMLKTQQDKVSYSIGIQIGSSVKQQAQQQGLDVKPDIIAAGLKDALSDAKPLLNEQEVRETLMAVQREVMGKQAELGEKNKKEGEAFLEANKKKPGVKTLPSGLQYQVLKEGKGPKPQATETVKAAYKGTLINGTEFDNSDKHGGPATFSLAGVIPGWTEALQLMPVGSKWRLFIPSDLAYAERGAGGLIGPNATLIFEVELMEIEKDAPSAN